MRKIWWEKWKDQVTESMLENDLTKSEVFVKTPYGMIPQRVTAVPESNVNFWLVYTNFDIGKDEIITINNTDGIEIFTYFTPYCFRISIGKLFNNIKVLKKLASNLGCTSYKKNLALNQQQINEIKKAKIDLSNHKYWLIYVLPNGNFQPNAFDNEFDFLSCRAYFTNLKDIIGGQVLSTLTDKIGV